MKEIVMFRVSYSIKDKNGFIADKHLDLLSFDEVAKLVRKLVNENKTIGKPIIERI
jgi:hypothetical protein